MKRKKKKRLFIILFLLIIIISALFIIYQKPIYSFYNEIILGIIPNEEILKKLTYNENTITLFKEKEIDSYIVKSNKYSKTLEIAINDENYNKDNIDYYLNIEYQEKDNFIKNINKLVSIGYNIEEINNIYKHYNDNSINKILEIEYTKDILEYINIDYFIEDYLTKYINYKKNNNDVQIEDIITFVNIGLDHEFYTETKDITNQDDILVLVNKYHKLSSDYVPKNLETVSSKYSTKSLKLVNVAKEKFESMCADAESVNITIKAGSTYRSYSYQSGLYNAYVKRDGKKEADTYSARAGYSEHQTGLAIDIKGANNEYVSENDNEYKWLLNNAHKYGFILRYPKDKVHITGYMFEEWHFRYVGIDIATYIYDNKLTFDEYIAKRASK